MIRINLLPRQKRVKATNVRKELWLWLLLLFVVTAGIGGSLFWTSSTIDALEQDKTAKTAIRATLLTKVAKVNSLKRKLAETRRKIEIIRDIRERQGLPVRYIDVLVSRMPEGKIWFEAFSLGDDGRMDIRGVALNNQSFAAYVERLRQSEYISGVVTRRTSRRTVQGFDLVEFTVNVMAGPAPSLEKANG
jgi:type IV pilus assembly protein PilN